jgi:hypothetical protein
MAVTIRTRWSKQKDSQILLFFFLHDNMSSTISGIVGAIGSWLGGWSATLLALLIAPPLEKVRDTLFPPPPPPTPGPSAAQVNRLIKVNEFLYEEVRRLRESRRAREEPLYTRWISGSFFVVAARTLILDRLLRSSYPWLLWAPCFPTGGLGRAPAPSSYFYAVPVTSNPAG